MSEDEARREARRAVDALGGRGDFATAAGVDGGTLADFLDGRRWPHAKTRTKIEHALGWPLGRLQDIKEGAHAVITTQPTRPAEDVVAAILADQRLVPDAQAHLVAAYELLLRLDLGPTEAQERARVRSQVEALAQEKLAALDHPGAGRKGPTDRRKTGLT